MNVPPDDDWEARIERSKREMHQPFAERYPVLAKSAFVVLGLIVFGIVILLLRHFIGN
jgi:hypothetical protein